jgi:L-cystine uptake protein TcyP (sodium:dicarboxylate symporter family)
VYAKTTDIARPEKIKQKIENFSEELAFSRKKLREVRRNVHYEIKNAERNIKLINMVIVPSCFGILALFILIVRQSKMRSLNQKIKG